MKRILLGSTTALALLAFPVTASPILQFDVVGKPSFHFTKTPVKAPSAKPGPGHRFGISNHSGAFGFCGLTSKTGSTAENFNGPPSASGYKGADFRIPEDAFSSGPHKPGHHHPGPVSGAQPIPEPSTLALFGLFSVFLALRSRWATWRR
jgi:hypothetical protein